MKRDRDYPGAANESYAFQLLVEYWITHNHDEGVFVKALLKPYTARFTEAGTAFMWLDAGISLVKPSGYFDEYIVYI